MKARVSKIWLENEHRKRDNFASISSCLRPVLTKSITNGVKERCWITTICCLAAWDCETQWSVYRLCRTARIYLDSTNCIIVFWRCRRLCHRRFLNLNSLFNQQSDEKIVFIDFLHSREHFDWLLVGEATNFCLSVLPYKKPTPLVNSNKIANHLAHIYHTEWEIGISLVRYAQSWDIELSTRREIPYL